jgi:hypothetical protein
LGRSILGSRQTYGEVSLKTEEELRLQAENLDLRRLLQQAGMHAAERQTVEQLQSLLVGELHHRIKNILATVMAITSQSLRSAESMDDGRKAIEQRLLALGRAHLLLQANWKSAQLREILSSAIAPFNSETPSRFVIQSSNIEAAASAAVPLAMAATSYAPTPSNTARYRDRMGELRSALRPTSCKISFVCDGRSTVVHPFGLRRRFRDAADQAKFRQSAQRCSAPVV